MKVFSVRLVEPVFGRVAPIAGAFGHPNLHDRVVAKQLARDIALNWRRGPLADEDPHEAGAFLNGKAPHADTPA